jgi:hypothetical protein
MRTNLVWFRRKKAGKILILTTECIEYYSLVIQQIFNPKVSLNSFISSQSLFELKLEVIGRCCINSVLTYKTHEKFKGCMDIIEDTYFPSIGEVIVRNASINDIWA